MKRTILFTVLAMFAFTALQAQQPEIFSTNGKAIRGYDAVAFFKEGKPVQGNDSLAYQWKETSWLFSTQSNLDSFKVAPEKYAPQYGGYCAYGVSQDHKSPTQTDTWTILNGKLYFNYNLKVKDIWSKNQQAFINKAEQNWPALRNK